MKDEKNLEQKIGSTANSISPRLG